MEHTLLLLSKLALLIRHSKNGRGPVQQESAHHVTQGHHPPEMLLLLSELRWVPYLWYCCHATLSAITVTELETCRKAGIYQQCLVCWNLMLCSSPALAAICKFEASFCYLFNIIHISDCHGHSAGVSSSEIIQSQRRSVLAVQAVHAQIHSLMTLLSWIDATKRKIQTEKAAPGWAQVQPWKFELMFMALELAQQMQKVTAAQAATAAAAAAAAEQDLRQVTEVDNTAGHNSSGAGLVQAEQGKNELQESKGSRQQAAGSRQQAAGSRQHKSHTNPQSEQKQLQGNLNESGAGQKRPKQSLRN